MTTLPAGVVTFLMTDVEGSTRLWEQHSQVMTDVLALHDRIVAGAVDGAGGVLLRDRSEGDSSFAVFADPVAALAAAVELQRNLGSAAWPLGLTVRARAAIHSGTAEPRSGSYYGPLVNRVVRLRAIGHGGQTLVSGATADVVGSSPLPWVTLADLGRHRLKDLVRPEQVYELRHPALEMRHPPLKSLDVLRHNLPDDAGPLIGRADDAQRVEKLLEHERVVALLGPGGVGKTRLGLHVAARLLDDFTGGTWFVDLTRLGVGSDVVEALATVVGAREQPGRPLLDTIADALGSAPVLFVLDNCEHVAPAVRESGASLLRRCSGLRMLLTSRDRVGLPGERIWRVEPLAPAEALDLFALRSGHSVTPTVEYICRRLDGVPLALEMAAAQVAVLGAEQVGESLSAGLGGLSGLGADGETLRATIDWSHDLLGDDERVLFRRLGVFTGPYDLEAVEGVCPDGTMLVEDDVLDLLAALVDASLVSLGEGGGYRLLEPIREYAGDQLRTADENQATRQRHLDWYRRLADDLKPATESADPVPALDRLELEHDNVIAALSWEDPAADRDTQMALANGLWRFWDLTGRWSEGRFHLERALERGSTFRTFRSTAHFHAGSLAERQSDLAGARHHQEQSLDILQSVAADLRQRGDDLLPTILLHVEVARSRLAELARLGSHFEEAGRLATQAVDGFRKLGADQYLSSPLDCLAMIAWGEGRLDECRALLEAALDLAHDAGQASTEGRLQNDLGATARARGHLDDAEQWYRRSLEQRRAIRDRFGEAESRFNLAELALQQGRSDLQEVLEVRAMYEELAHLKGVSDAELLLGDLIAADEPAVAIEHYAKARSIRDELQLPAPVLEADIRLTSMGKGLPVDELLSIAETLGDPTFVLEALIEAARARPDDATAVAWIGRARSLAQSRTADLEMIRVLETEGRVLGRPDLALEADRRREALGAPTTPRDRRWRARWAGSGA